MRIAALILIAVIAALHFYIAWFEIFSWTTRGPKVFTNFPKELFDQTITMAANQGIYNAFLAVGLGWSVLIKDQEWQVNVATCFLLFVVVASACNNCVGFAADESSPASKQQIIIQVLVAR